MHDFASPQPLSSTATDSTINDRNNTKIDQMDRPKGLNYAAVARAHSIDGTTLMRRYKGKSVSRAEATSTYHQQLNDV